MNDLFDGIVNPLLAAIKRELGAIVAKIHQSNSVPPPDPMSMGASSPYLKELIEKLEFVTREVLARFDVEGASREW